MWSPSPKNGTSWPDLTASLRRGLEVERKAFPFGGCQGLVVQGFKAFGVLGTPSLGTV